MQTCHNVDTNVINLSQDDNIQFEPPTLHRVLPSPELAKLILNQATMSNNYQGNQRLHSKLLEIESGRPTPLAHILIPQLSGVENPKCQNSVEIARWMRTFYVHWTHGSTTIRTLGMCYYAIMNSWINYWAHLNIMFILLKLHSMHTGVLEANPHWFQILLSESGWLDGDVSYIL